MHSLQIFLIKPGVVVRSFDLYWFQILTSQLTISLPLRYINKSFSFLTKIDFFHPVEKLASIANIFQFRSQVFNLCESVKICRTSADLCRNLQICRIFRFLQIFADLQNFYRSLQMCADWKKDQQPHSNVK